MQKSPDQFFKLFVKKKDPYYLFKLWE